MSSQQENISRYRDISETKSLRELEDFFESVPTANKTLQELGNFFEVESHNTDLTLDELTSRMAAISKKEKTVQNRKAFISKQIPPAFYQKLLDANQNLSQDEADDVVSAVAKVDKLVMPGGTEAEKVQANEDLISSGYVPVIAKISGTIQRLSGNSLRIILKTGTKQALRYCISQMYPGYTEAISFSSGIILTAVQEVPTLLQKDGLKTFGQRLYATGKTSARIEFGQLLLGLNGSAIQNFTGQVIGDIIGDQFEGLVLGTGREIRDPKEQHKVNASKIVQAKILQSDILQSEKSEDKLDESKMFEFLRANSGTMMTSAVMGGMMMLSSTFLMSTGEPIFKDMFQFSDIAASVTGGLFVDVASIPISAMTKTVDDKTDAILLGAGRRNPDTNQWEPSYLDAETKNRLRHTVQKETYYQLGLAAATKKMFEKRKLAEAAAYIMRKVNAVGIGKLTLASGAILQSNTEKSYDWFTGKQFDQVPEWKTLAEAQIAMGKAHMASKISLMKLLDETGGQLTFEEAMPIISEEANKVLNGEPLDLEYLKKLEARIHSANERSFQNAQKLAQEQQKYNEFKQTLYESQESVTAAKSFQSNILIGLDPDQPLSQTELTKHQVAMAKTLEEYQSNDLAKHIRQSLDSMILQDEVTDILDPEAKHPGILQQSRTGSLILQGGLAAVERLSPDSHLIPTLNNDLKTGLKISKYIQKAHELSQFQSIIATGADIGSKFDSMFQSLPEQKDDSDKSWTETLSEYIPSAPGLDDYSIGLQAASGILDIPYQMLQAVQDTTGLPLLTTVTTVSNLKKNLIRETSRASGLTQLSDFGSDRLDNIMTAFALAKIGDGHIADTFNHKLAQLSLGEKTTAYTWIEGQSETEQRLSKFVLGTLIGDSKVDYAMNLAKKAESMLQEQSKKVITVSNIFKLSQDLHSVTRNDLVNAFKVNEKITQRVEEIQGNLDYLVANQKYVSTSQKAIVAASVSLAYYTNKLNQKIEEKKKSQTKIQKLQEKSEKEIQELSKVDLLSQKSKKLFIEAVDFEILRKKELLELQLQKSDKIKAKVIPSLQWSEQLRPFMSTTGRSGHVIITDEMRQSVPGLQNKDVIRLTDGSIANAQYDLLDSCSPPSVLELDEVRVLNVDMISEMDSNYLESVDSPVILSNLAKSDTNNTIELDGTKRSTGGPNTSIKKGNIYPQQIVTDLTMKLLSPEILEKSKRAKIKTDIFLSFLNTSKKYDKSPILKESKYDEYDLYSDDKYSADSEINQESQSDDEQNEKQLKESKYDEYDLHSDDKYSADSEINQESQSDDEQNEKQLKVLKAQQEKKAREEEEHRQRQSKLKREQSMIRSRELEETIALQSRQRQNREESIKQSQEQEIQTKAREEEEYRQRMQKRTKNLKDMSNKLYSSISGMIRGSINIGKLGLSTIGQNGALGIGLTAMMYSADIPTSVSLIAGAAGGLSYKYRASLDEIVSGWSEENPENDIPENDIAENEEEESRYIIDEKYQNDRLLQQGIEIDGQSEDDLVLLETNRNISELKAERVRLEAANALELRHKQLINQSLQEKQSRQEERISRNNKKQQYAQNQEKFRQKQLRDERLKEEQKSRQKEDLLKENLYQRDLQLQQEENSRQQLRENQELQQQKLSPMQGLGYSIEPPNTIEQFVMSKRTKESVKALMNKFENINSAKALRIVLATMTSPQLYQLYPQSQDMSREKMIGNSMQGFYKSFIWKKYYKEALLFENSMQRRLKTYDALNTLVILQDLLKRLLAVQAIEEDSYKKYFGKVDEQILQVYTNVRWYK
jgi:hypothetical protein